MLYNEMEDVANTSRGIKKFSDEVKEDLWKIYFWNKPASIEEFLTEEYLGTLLVSLYPEVKQDIIAFYKSGESTWLNNNGLGTGKTLSSIVCALYNIYLYLNTREHTAGGSLSSVVALYSEPKINDITAFNLNISPFLNIMGKGGIFKQVKSIRVLRKKQNRARVEGRCVLYYTVENKELEFANNLKVSTFSDKASMMSTNIITAIALTQYNSEYSFKSKDWFNDASLRVFSRHGTANYAKGIVDSVIKNNSNTFIIKENSNVFVTNREEKLK